MRGKRLHISCHLIHRHDYGRDHHSDADTHDHHDDRLHQGHQIGDDIVNLAGIKNGNPLQNHIQTAGLFPDLKHLRNHGRNHRAVHKNTGDGITVFHFFSGVPDQVAVNFVSDDLGRDPQGLGNRNPAHNKRLQGTGEPDQVYPLKKLAEYRHAQDSVI